MIRIFCFFTVYEKVVICFQACHQIKKIYLQSIYQTPEIQKHLNTGQSSEYNMFEVWTPFYRWNSGLEFS